MTFSAEYELNRAIDHLRNMQARLRHYRGVTAAHNERHPDHQVQSWHTGEAGAMQDVGYALDRLWGAQHRVEMERQTPPKRPAVDVRLFADMPAEVLRMWGVI